MPCEASLWAGIELKDEVKQNLINAIITGNCEKVSNILTSVDKARRAINSVFKPEKDEFTISMYIHGDKDIEKFLKNGLKCFDKTTLVFAVNIGTTITDEFYDEDIYEEEDYPVYQTVRINTPDDLMKIIDKIESGKVPIYGGAVDADAFINMKEFTKKYGKGTMLILSPDIYEVEGIDYIGYEAHVTAEKKQGNIRLTVRTGSMAEEHGVEKEYVAKCMQIAEGIARDYGIKKLETYVSVEIND